MSHATTGNVFDHLGFDPGECTALKMKAEIFNEIIDCAQEQSLSKKDLQETLRVPQTRVSELLKGQISKVSIEKLLGYLQALGREPASLKFERASAN